MYQTDLPRWPDPEASPKAEKMIYVQSYDIAWDEMMNVPVPRARTAELRTAHVEAAYAEPVPWRRIIDGNSHTPTDAPDPEWHSLAQSDRVKNRVRQATWYDGHENLMRVSLKGQTDAP